MLRHRQCGHYPGNTGIYGRTGHSAVQGEYIFRHLVRTMGAASGGLRDMGDDLRNILDRPSHARIARMPYTFLYIVA